MLLKHFKPETPLTKEERTAIESLKKMLNQIVDVKEKHERPALRPPLITAPIDRLCRQLPFPGHHVNNRSVHLIICFTRFV